MRALLKNPCVWFGLLYALFFAGTQGPLSLIPDGYPEEHKIALFITFALGLIGTYLCPGFTPGGPNPGQSQGTQQNGTTKTETKTTTTSNSLGAA